MAVYYTNVIKKENPSASEMLITSLLITFLETVCNSCSCNKQTFKWFYFESVYVDVRKAQDVYKMKLDNVLQGNV